MRRRIDLAYALSLFGTKPLLEIIPAKPSHETIPTHSQLDTTSMKFESKLSKNVFENMRLPMVFLLLRPQV